jgi:thiamine-phosphate pyrophosphorylase
MASAVRKPKLCLATSSKIENEANLLALIEQALRGGLDAVRLTDVALDREAYCRLARKIRELCAKYDAKLVIHNRVECAAEVAPDGIELTMVDNPAANEASVQAARAAVSKDCLVGMSCPLSVAVQRLPSNVDFVGVGPLFPDSDRLPASAAFSTLQQLGEFVRASKVHRVAAFGELNRRNISQVLSSGVEVVVVSREILASGDPQAATRGLKKFLEEVSRGRSKL